MAAKQAVLVDRCHGLNAIEEGLIAAAVARPSCQFVLVTLSGSQPTEISLGDFVLGDGS